MRIGLVCPYSLDLPGGVQNHVLGLARYLWSRGHQAAVLAPTLRPTGHAARYGLPEDQVTSAGGTVALPYNGSVARVSFGPLSVARVRRWLAEGDFDLVHLHEPITPSISVLGLWLAQIPVVATFHTATPRSRAMQLARTALRPGIEKIDVGIAVSEAARKVVIQHLGRDSVVIPNGFDYAEFARPFPAGWGQANPVRPRVCFLGRLDEPRKGLETFVAAIPELRRRFPGLEILVAGQGAARLPQSCQRLGLISDAERAGLLRSCQVFVAPHHARESFGLVLVEAMASGAAVVASDLPAFRDVLHADPASSVAGHLFAPGDVLGLTSAITEVLMGDRTAMITRAQRLSRRYDWSRVGAEVVEIYQAALATGVPLAGSG